MLTLGLKRVLNRYSTNSLALSTTLTVSQGMPSQAHRLIFQKVQNDYESWSEGEMDGRA